MEVVVDIESPLQDDVRMLIGELNAALLDLTPPEFCFHMTVEEMATPQIDRTLMTVRNPLFCERTWRAATNDVKRRPSRRSRP